MKIAFTFTHNNGPKQSMTVDAPDIRSGLNQALDALGNDRMDDLDSVEVVTEDQFDMHMIFDQ